MRLCQTCGKRLPENARVCRVCGAPQPALPAARKKRGRAAAIVVGIIVLGLVVLAALSAAGVSSLLRLPARLLWQTQPDAAPEAPESDAVPVSEDGTQPLSAAAPDPTAPAPSAAATEPAPTAAPVPAGPVPAYEKVGNLLVCGNAAFSYYYYNEAVAGAYAAAVNRAAALLEGRARVYVMTVPTGIDIALDPRVRSEISSDDQRQAEADLRARFSPQVCAVPVVDALLAHRDDYLYFRTDHHWTGLAAYYAYAEFCRAKGVQPVALAACARRDFGGFLGTYYNETESKRDVLGETPDVVETYMPPADATLTVYDDGGNTVYSGSVIYNEDHSIPANKYGAFVYGDNAFSVIENRSLPAGKSCLLIKDSYGNAVAPLLTADYKTVYIMDFRHCSKTVAQLVSAYGIDDVLFADNLQMTCAANLVEQLAARIG